MVKMAVEDNGFKREMGDSESTRDCQWILSVVYLSELIIL